MTRKRDELRWTPAGEAALAELAQHGFVQEPARGAALHAKIAATCATYAKRVARASRGDAAVMARASKLLEGWSPRAKLVVEDAAVVATCLGACATDADIAPYLTYVLDTGGAPFAIDVLVAMWRLASDHGTSTGIALHAVDVATTAAHDASVSYGKGDIVQFLRDAGRRDSVVRAALAAAVDAAYADAPLPAQAALIAAVDDGARANALVRQLGKLRDVYPHWAWRWLPAVVTDLALLKALQAKGKWLPSLAELARLGPRAIGLFATAATTPGSDGRWREDLLGVLTNVHGPKTARVMAAYVTSPRHKATTTAYLKKYPELLADVLADPACADDHPYLTGLVA